MNDLSPPECFDELTDTRTQPSTPLDRPRLCLAGLIVAIVAAWGCASTVLQVAAIDGRMGRDR